MPELPEVELLCRQLERILPGRTVVDFECRKAKLCRLRAIEAAGSDDPAARMRELLVGRRIEAVDRRGKFLLWALSGGLVLAIHLKLAGQVVVVGPDGRELARGGHWAPRPGVPLPHRATHVVFRLDDGSVVYLTDIRQFARLTLMPAGEVEAFLREFGLGPDGLREPIDPDRLEQVFRRRPKAPIKAVLLDQAVVAGLGNIYADEVLFATGIHPLRPAAGLSRAEIEALAAAIPRILSRAVVEGAAPVIGDRAAQEDGLPEVHGREGQPCRRCGSPIRRIRVGGRSTYFCPVCQPLKA
jgi:formamidopyrimidine-DNA glycosylase